MFICGFSLLLAGAAGVIAQLLVRLIALVTNLAFYGRLSREPCRRPATTSACG